MVNFGLNSASLLGIFLAVAGAALYFLRTVRPELARDHDIFFAAVGLLCGFILLFQGWRLDPILQFGQFLLTGSAIFFGFESIRMRGLATEVAKRNTQIVDEDRPVSRVYRAELDQLEPMDEEPPRRRIRGTQESRNSRTVETYEDEPRRRPSSRSNSSPSNSNPERLGQGDRPRKRRPRPTETRPTEQPDDWEVSDTWEEKPSRSSRPSSTRPPSRDPETAAKPRRSRPPRGESSERSPNRESREDVEATPTDYVDYKPIDYPEDEGGNSSNFDQE